MNSFDDNEKVQKIIKYVKYIIPLIIVLVLIFILFKGTNYSALEEKLIEATKKCYLDGKCDTNYITLQDLYDKGYLKKQTDPLTKKYYDPESKIIKENEKITLKLS